MEQYEILSLHRRRLNIANDFVVFAGVSDTLVGLEEGTRCVNRNRIARPETESARIRDCVKACVWRALEIRGSRKSRNLRAVRADSNKSVEIAVKQLGLTARARP